MFILRIIEETRENESSPFQQVIENFQLGNSYSVLTKGRTKEFDDEMERHYPENSKKGIRALLCAENGLRFFIQDEASLLQYHYFIMYENGQTFEKL